MKRILAPLFVVAILSWSFLHVNYLFIQHRGSIGHISKGHTVSKASLLKSPALHAQFTNGGAAPTQTGKSSNPFIEGAEDISVIRSAEARPPFSGVARIYVQQYLYFIYPSHNFW